MPSAETVERIAQLAERFGWPIVALAVLLILAVMSGRSVVKGACYVWGRAEPYVLGILGSHQDLMDTAKDQMPRQTAILEELTAGQREHTTILKSLHSSVEGLRRDSKADISVTESPDTSSTG